MRAGGASQELDVEVDDQVLTLVGALRPRQGIRLQRIDDPHPCLDGQVTTYPAALRDRGGPERWVG